MDDEGWANLKEVIQVADQYLDLAGLIMEDYMEVLLHSWHPGRGAYRFEVSTVPLRASSIGAVRTEVRALYKRTHSDSSRR
jgi:hypothetical protein